MDSNQLYHFRAIAEEKNITRAANKLYVTQPALSISLGKLENELGVTLFIREGKKLSLTNDGKRLLKYAITVTDTIEEAKKCFATGGKRKVTLFHTGGVNYPLISIGCISKENFLFSGVLVENDDLRKGAESGAADIVISDDRHLPEETDDICKEFLYRQHLLCCIPKAHPLNAKKTVSIKELSNYSIVGHANPRGFNDWFGSVKRINRCEVREDAALNFPTWKAEGGKLFLPFVMNDFGISTVWDTVKDLKIVPLTGKYCERDIYIWYRKEHAEKLKEIIDQIKDNVNRIQKEDKIYLKF